MGTLLLTMCLFFNPVRSIFVLMFSVVCSGISIVWQNGDFTVDANRDASSRPWPSAVMGHVKPSGAGCTAPEHEAMSGSTAARSRVRIRGLVIAQATDSSPVQKFVMAVAKEGFIAKRR